MSDVIGSWDEDRRRKFLVGLDATIDERIAWLEEMLEIAFAAGALPKPRDEWGQAIAPRRSSR